jgi:hypothetical protein
LATSYYWGNGMALVCDGNVLAHAGEGGVIAGGW